MASFAEVVTQTFRNLTPESLSERLFGNSIEDWWADYTRALEKTQYNGPVRIAFFITTFALLGRLARIDGVVSESEINMTRKIMNQLDLNPAQQRLAQRLFNEGRQHDFDTDALLDRFYRQARNRVSVLQIFMELQMQVAVADSVLTDGEQKFLLRIANRLDISEAVYQRIEERVCKKQGIELKKAPLTSGNIVSLADACRAIGVSRWADKKEIKLAYRKKLSEFHPDRMIARGASDVDVAFANQKMMQVKQAYDLISKVRRIR